MNLRSNTDGIVHIWFHEITATPAGTGTATVDAGIDRVWPRRNLGPVGSSSFSKQEDVEEARCRRNLGPVGSSRFSKVVEEARCWRNLGFLGSPQVYVRFIAIKNSEEIKKGKIVAVLYTLITSSSAVVIGMLGRFMFTTSNQSPELALGVAGENVLYLLLIEINDEVLLRLELPGQFLSGHHAQGPLFGLGDL